MRVYRLASPSLLAPTLAEPDSYLLLFKLPRPGEPPLKDSLAQLRDHLEGLGAFDRRRSSALRQARARSDDPGSWPQLRKIADAAGDDACHED